MTKLSKIVENAEKSVQDVHELSDFVKRVDVLINDILEISHEAQQVGSSSETDLRAAQRRGTALGAIEDLILKFDTSLTDEPDYLRPFLW